MRVVLWGGEGQLYPDGWGGEKGELAQGKRVEGNAPRVAASFLQNKMKCNWDQGQFLYLDSPL